MAKKESMRGYQEGGLSSDIGRRALDSLITPRRERPDYITSIDAYDELDRKLIANDMAKLAILLRDDFDLSSTPMGQRVLASLRPRSIADIQRLIDAQNVVSRGVFTEGTSGSGEGLMAEEPQQARRATNWSTRAVEEARARGESLGSSRGSSQVYEQSDRNIGIDAGDAAQRARDAGIFTVLGRNRNVGTSNASDGGETPAIAANLEGVTAEEYEAAKAFVDNHPLASASPEGLRQLMVTIGEGQERASRKDRFGVMPAVAMDEGGLMRRTERLPNLDQMARDAIVKQAQQEYNQPLEGVSDEKVAAAGRAMADFVPGVGDALGIKDAYETVTDPNASTMAKAAAVGLASLGFVPLVGDAVAAPMRAAARQADALRIQDNIADRTTDVYSRANEAITSPNEAQRRTLDYAVEASDADVPQGFFLDPSNYPNRLPSQSYGIAPKAPQSSGIMRAETPEPTPAPRRVSGEIDKDELEYLTDEWSRGNIENDEFRKKARQLGVIIRGKNLNASTEVEDIFFDLPDGRLVRGLDNI